jgi:ribonuclease-3
MLTDKIKFLIDNLGYIENKIDYQFIDKSLLISAFIHNSFINSPTKINIDDNILVLQNNQRLEFLGDSILNYLVSIYAYEKYPFFNEENLSYFRSLIVNYLTLSKILKSLDLDSYLVFNYESLGSNSIRTKTYADLMEAIIGAIYYDSVKNKNDTNLFYVTKFFNNIILKKFYELIDEVMIEIFDWKGFLQTIFQRKGMESLKYVTIEKRVNEFVCVAVLDNVEVSIGFGKTKKEAEKKAAFNFFINKINTL